MLCYRCGSQLGSGKYCLRCGADVTMYRRLVRLSNRYYNLGLDKARGRDLSGAAADLSLSLEIDKRNIQARNLLGLVLYEMGETVDALCHWVISTNFQPENNIASDYVKLLQNDRTGLDIINQAIRKYNSALDYARKGNEDLAVMQLQWALKQHPNMLKARSLLALLYAAGGENSRAEKEIRQLLKFDHGNLYAQQLSRELSLQNRRVSLSRPEQLRLKTGEKLQQAQEESARVKTALTGRPGFLLRIVLTVFLFTAMLVGLLLPTIRRERSTAVNSAVIPYAEQLEVLRIRLNDSEREIEAYETLFTLSRLSLPKDYAEAAALFASLSENQVPSEEYRTIYNSWKEELDKWAESARTEPSSTEKGTETSDGTGGEEGNERYYISRRSRNTPVSFNDGNLEAAASGL